jgi:hypothetical protein
VLAPFAGTVKKNLMRDADGAVVRAGQPIFEIAPDEVLVEETASERLERRKRVTLMALGG